MIQEIKRWFDRDGDALVMALCFGIAAACLWLLFVMAVLDSANTADQIKLLQQQVEELQRD